MMELQFPSWLLLFTIIPSFVMIVHTVKITMAGYSPVPGRWRLPLRGNQLRLGSLTQSSPVYSAMKRGPLMHIELGRVSTYAVSSPEISDEVLHNHDLVFSDRPISFVPHPPPSIDLGC
uniref:Cytochrome P450 71D9-like n=1 Tax=Rhizophora mucronata TaxID=61149 RepID=A0A2P2Q5K3_RHIMU